MIDTADLTHRLVLNRVTQSGVRDSYSGKKAEARTEVVYQCFYDGTKKKIRDMTSGHDIEVSGIIFLHPSSPISLRDELVRVEDALGNTIIEKTLRVIAVNPATDDVGVHHIELLLFNDHGVS